MSVNMDILRELVANQEMDVNVICMAVGYLTTDEQNEVLGQLTEEEQQDETWGKIVSNIVQPQLQALNEEAARTEAIADRLAGLADVFRRPQPLTPQQLGDTVDLAQSIERVNEEAGFHPGGAGDGGNDEEEKQREEEEEEEKEHEREEEEEEEEREREREREEEGH